MNCHGFIKKFLFAVIYILSLSLWQIAVAHPQLTFENISKNQGLSDNGVNDFVQDEQGFLWIATDNGLNQYDGFNFITYQHNAKDANSLPSNAIYALHIDQQNRLWIGTDKGLCLFNDQTKTFFF